MTRQFSALLVLLSMSFSAVSNTLVFGVVPQQSAKKLAQSWAPMLTYLSQQSGIQLEFATAKDIPAFEQRLANAEYDIAYMNPYHYVVFSKNSGYRALARQKNKRIHGIIAVPHNSAIQSLADLQGKRMAFPAPAAFAATIIPQSTLEGEGISINAFYVSSHDSVYLNVARALFPAGGGVVRTLRSATQDTQDALRILWKSPGYTPHAIATSVNVNEQERQALLSAMLNANEDPKAKLLLKHIAFKGFEAGSNNDWDDVRALDISRIKTR